MKARTKRKNIKYKILEEENIKYQEIVRQLQNKIRYDDYLKKENEKLIEWVQSILEQFGTFDINSRERIQIPIMRKIDNYSDGLHNEPITTETIVIPEISISKMSYRK